MTVPRVEKAYEKHAWILLFVLGIGTLVVAFSSLASGEIEGRFPGPVEFAGALGGWGIFIIVVSRTSYRKGERWAWYVSSYLPVAYATFVVYDFSLGGSRAQFAVLPASFLIIALLGLLLPYRKFFPRK